MLPASTLCWLLHSVSVLVCWTRGYIIHTVHAVHAHWHSLGQRRRQAAGGGQGRGTRRGVQIQYSSTRGRGTGRRCRMEGGWFVSYRALHNPGQGTLNQKHCATLGAAVPSSASRRPAHRQGAGSRPRRRPPFTTASLLMQLRAPQRRITPERGPRRLLAASLGPKNGIFVASSLAAPRQAAARAARALTGRRSRWRPRRRGYGGSTAWSGNPNSPCPIRLGRGRVWGDGRRRTAPGASGDCNQLAAAGRALLGGRKPGPAVRS